MKERVLIFVKKMKHTSPMFASMFNLLYVCYKSALVMRGLINWFFVNPVLSVITANKMDKRILIIYDLSGQPFSIGDIILFQEASLVLLEQHGCTVVDFALVYDPNRPTPPDPALSNINEDNCLFHLASILPVAQVNQHLGSLLLFNSHDQLEHFVADNIYRYQVVWPSAGTYLSREYMHYYIFNELFKIFYQKYNRLPNLKSRSNMLSWAVNFLHEHVFPSIPVTVQLRRNVKNPDRNSQYDVWPDFFDFCNERYPVKFIIICAESEIDERFRNFPNVIRAKDFRTHIEQDLALINSAAIHMGASSGPGSMALFSSKPYLFLNTPPVPLIKSGFIQNGDIVHAYFATPVQNFRTTPESFDILSTEFEKMWATLDMEHWDKIIKQAPDFASDHYSWLR